MVKKVWFSLICLTIILSFNFASAQMMPPGGPDDNESYYSDIYSAAQNLYRYDKNLDISLKEITSRMRDGSITYQEAFGRLQSALSQAERRRSYWQNNFSANQNGQLFYAMGDLLGLQTARCAQLLDATAYEHRYGLSAAGYKWQDELKTFKSYEKAQKRVKNLIFY